MPAQANYLASILDTFAAFLALQEVDGPDRDAATLLFIYFLEKKQNYDHWNEAELAAFLEKNPEARQFAQTPKQLVRQFVSDYPPYQTNVLLYQYLLALKNEGCSYSTIKNYRSDINQFLQFSNETAINQAIAKPKVVSFLRYQRQKGLKRSSVRRKLVSIAQFTAWLESRSLLSRTGEWLQQISAALENIDTWAVAGSESEGEDAGQAGQTDQAAVAVTPTPVKTKAVKGNLPLKSLVAPGVAGGSVDIKPPPAKTKTKETAQGQQEFRTRLKQQLSVLSNRVESGAKNKLLPYINIAMIGLFVLGAGFFGYQQFIRDADSPLAFPTTLTPPNRTLSFQGRLTDPNRTPVDDLTNIRFVLYDDGPGTSGGNILWNSGTCVVDPDQDGIFSVGLGDDCGGSITDDVFTEHSNVWLQIEIDNGEEYEVLEPRQSIKTVPYAINAETLQGFPPAMSAIENTILVMDENGDINLGSLNPDLRATSGTFTIEAQSLVLQTASGSDGDIVLAPDGTGEVGVLSDLFLAGYLWAPGATLSATYAGGNPLVINGVSGQTANLTEWNDGNGNVTVIDEDGRIGIGNNNPSYGLDVNGDARITTLGAGATDTVVTHASGVLQSRSIDSRVWGSTLIDGSGTANYVARWSDADTLTTGVLYDNNTNVGIGTTSPGSKLTVHNQGDAATGEALLRLNQYEAQDFIAGHYNGSGTANFRVDSTGNVYSNVFYAITDPTYFLNPTGSTSLTTIGDVGIGTNSPAAMLDVVGVSSNMSALFADNVTNNTTKLARIGLRHYINAEEPVGLIYAESNFSNTTNSIHIGGGVSQFNAANTISFYTAANSTTTTGTARMFINAAGDVGIGTTSPANPFHVFKNVSTFGGSAFGQSAAVQLSVGPGAHEPILRFQTNGTSRWELFTYGTTSGNAGKFGIADGTNHTSPALVIDTNKFVGIGTTDPSALLEVAGAFGTSTTGFKLYNNSAASTSNISEIGFNLNRTTGGRTQTAAIRGLITDISNTEYRGALAFLTSGPSLGGAPTEKMRIDTDGRVGIGTNNPIAALDVIGNQLDVAALTALFSNITANNTNKIARIGIRHYANAEEPVGLIHAISTSSSSDLSFGGGDSAFNAATTIGFYTAADSTTTAGTARMFINAAGDVGIGTTSPNATLDVFGAVMSRSSTGGIFQAHNPNNGAASVNLGWLSDIARIMVGGTGAGADNGLDIQGPSDTSFLYITSSGIRVSGGGAFVGNAPAASISLAGNGLIQGGTPTTNLSVFQTTTIAGGDAGYGAWMTHNAYFDGEKWRQPRGAGTNSYLFTSNYHFGWSWRFAGANGTNNAQINPVEVANLSAAGIFKVGNYGGTQTIPNGAGGNFTSQIQTVQTSGIAGISVGINDGTNNPRAGLFLNHTNAVWGLSMTYNSGGALPFVVTIGNNERLRIIANGNVGIGTTTPATKLHVNGNARIVFAAAAANSVCRDGNGTFTTCSSLAQYKDNKQNLSLGLETIMQLRPVEFDWNIDDKSHDLGLIAEEVAAVNPILAQYESDGSLSGVKYHHMVALLVKGIQQQQEQIVSLSSQLALLNPNTSAALQLNNFFIDSTGNLAIEKTANDNYQVRDTANNSLATAVGRMAELVVGRIRAGSIAVRELSVDTITIAGLPLQDYIASTLLQMGGGPEGDGSGELISPVAHLDSLEVTGETLLADLLVTENATFSGTLTAETTLLGELTAETATIAGTLVAENIEAGDITAATISAHSTRLAMLESRVAEFERVKAETAEFMDATISGTLYADTIMVRNKIALAEEKPSIIEIIKEKVVQEEGGSESGGGNLQPVYDTVAGSGYEASSSADLDWQLSELQLATSDVVITGQALYLDNYLRVNGSAFIADSLGVGGQLLVGQGMRLADGSISYTAPAGAEQLLEIQPSGAGTLSLMAGLLTLTEDGHVTISGNLTVAGALEVQDTLLANLIQPADFGNPFQVQVAGADTSSGEVKESRFEIINELGTPVATISAEGRADFAAGIGVGSEKLSVSEDDSEVESNKTSGRAAVPAGAKEITIRSQLITENSLIYVTPVGSTQNQVLYVKSQQANNSDTSGKFVVGFDATTPEKVNFNWWIVN